MTDYNDGEWRLWDGSDRLPDGVHPESLVTHIWHDENTGGCGMTKDAPANNRAWSHTLKFRVTKPHREPRVIYVNEYADGGIGYNNPDIARRAAMQSATSIAVRYVEAPE
jgi:hypothetical protein